METSSVVGFALTLGFLAVFLAVSVRQLARVRKVAAGEITVGPRPSAAVGRAHPMPPGPGRVARRGPGAPALVRDGPGGGV